MLNKLGEELKNIYFGEKIFIITDENVDKYYGSKVKDELDKIGYKTRKIYSQKTHSIINIRKI